MNHGGVGATEVGPYWIEQTLAAGAVSVVYLGVHLESGARYAIKVLHGSDLGDLESFQREIHTLSRLEHPGVVRVYETGLVDGKPWYSMEYLEGGTLRQRWESEEERDVLAAVRLVQQLCAPLSFLHGEGIVHRDLKPENVGFRRDGSPVIMDFGLMSRFGARVGRESIEPGGTITGSVDYMAPEQVRCEYVDARADLYALGCVLNEAITGHPPFRGDPWHVMKQHLESHPSPPSRRVPGASSDLDDVVLRLLEKTPADRFGYAVDVERALARVTGCAAGSGADIRAYLYRPGFVGREEALARIQERLRRCYDGAGGLVFVRGESGSGKTRLAMEATRIATAQGFSVFTGECVPLPGLEGASPVRAGALHPFRPVLRAVAEHCHRLGPCGTRKLLGRRAKMLAPYEPALGTVPEFDQQAEPAQISPQAARARVLGDLAETIAALAEDEPLMIVLDDLQWADDMTLAFLDSVEQGALGEASVLLLATYRSEEIGGSVRALEGRPSIERIETERLGAADLGRLIGDMLAIAPPPAPLVEFLATASEGNPFFVAEYLRASVSEGFLERADSGDWRLSDAARARQLATDSIPLPQTLRELVARRLEGLETVASRLVSAAAVLGREFDLDLASRLVDLDAGDRLDATSELLRRQIVEPGAERAYRFAHDKLREVVSERLPEADAVALHGRAAALLETQYAGRTDFPRHYAALAHHHSMAGANEEAIRYLGLAGAHALDSGSYRDCLRLIEKAFELGGLPGARPRTAFERARWNRMRGVASFGLAELDDSIRYTEAALRDLGEHVPHSTGGWLWVLLSELPGQLLGARAGGWMGRRRSVRDDMHFEVAAASDQLATSSYYAALPVPAVANLLRGINRAESAGAHASLPESCARLGFIAGVVGLDRVSRAYFRRSRAARAAPRHEGRRAAALYMEAMHAMGRCEWERCHTLAMESADTLERLGDRHEAEVARTIGANGLYYAGRHAESLAQSVRVHRSAATHGSRVHLAWGGFMTNRPRLAMGTVMETPESAALLVSELEESRRALQPLPDSLSLAMCEGVLAWAHLLSGDLDRAVRIAELLIARFARGQRPAVPQCLEGYAIATEVLLRHWAREGAVPSSPARQAVRSACNELKRFGGRFPLARPAALRCVAWEQALLGRDRRAEKLLDGSLRMARSQGMPFEELQSRLLAARLARDEETRDRHAMLADSLGVSIGCASHLRVVRALDQH